MFESVFMYEIILIIYGLSLVGYFIDFIQHNRKANQAAFWLLSIVWLLQTFILIDQIFFEKNIPVLTVNDGLFFYAWVRSEEHTSELQSRGHLVCRRLL